MGSHPRTDFFISYTQTDQAWAEWIAWHLESAGHATVIQAWDFHAGQRFGLAMHEAARTAKHTIAVLSPDYLRSDFAKSEWEAAFVADPAGKKSTLIPIKVRPVDVDGQLMPIIHIDLIGLNRKEAVELLLTRIKASEDGVRAKPASEPDFPGASSPNESRPAKSPSLLIEKKPPPPEFKLGLLDKKKQARQILAQIPKEQGLCNGRAWGFLLTGCFHEWPQALRFKLAYAVEADLMLTMAHAPELLKLDADKLNIQAKPAHYLWELLGLRLNCQATPSAITTTLEEKRVCQVIYRELSSDESSNHKLLAEMLEAWSQLQLARHSPSHFLLLIRETEHEEKPRRAWFGKRRGSWFENMQGTLSDYGLGHCLLPPLETPKWEDDINDWLRQHFNEDVREVLKSAITQAHGKAPAIPHGALKKTLLPLLK
jgi:hypothetical protein